MLPALNFKWCFKGCNICRDIKKTPVLIIHCKQKIVNFNSYTVFTFIDINQIYVLIPILHTTNHASLPDKMIYFETDMFKLPVRETRMDIFKLCR